MLRVKNINIFLNLLFFYTVCEELFIFCFHGDGKTREIRIMCVNTPIGKKMEDFFPSFLE